MTNLIRGFTGAFSLGGEYQDTIFFDDFNVAANSALGTGTWTITWRV